LGREAEEFASLDIGLYPLPDDPWTRGKSGLKALQYLAAGVPYIASPVGVVGEIGIPGTTHLEATTPEEWQLALGALLADPDLRARMGASARQYAESNYTLEHATAAMADALRESAG
jgi:glycosyltransferase involved in cell wall biosynthesis